jgi:hypothetical protein
MAVVKSVVKSTSGAARCWSDLLVVGGMSHA